MKRNYKEIYKEITNNLPFHIIIPFKYQYGNAFTFYCFILTKTNNIPILCHELKHVEQFYQYPLTFIFRYAYQAINYGYKNNRFEVEAEEVEQQAKRK